VNEETEFKFPHEVDEVNPMQVEDTAEDFKIEIEDDTPEQDRNRKPLPQNIVEELDKDDLEDYSDKVKKRLSQMKKVWHDERRAKEAAAREREEALRFAQQQFEENRRLKQQLGVGEKAYISEATKSANTDLTVAKEKLKQAYEAGDAELITNAQEALTDAKLRIKEVQRFRPTLQTEKQRVQPNQQVTTPQVSAPPVDQKALEWQQKNTWFGADEEMTALALGLHEKLVKAGVDPRSDDYYRRVDDTMRKRFPEAFNDADEEEQSQTRTQSKPASRTKPATNVVAPVTRSTAPRQVRLTPTQVAIAKKLGLSNEQYAKELMKLEAN